MGAKTWMLVYTDGNARELLANNPDIDRDATSRLAAQLFPKEKLLPLNDGSLDFTCPPDDELHIGCYPGVSVVAAGELGIDYPSRLPASFLKPPASTIYLHAMHSVVDWFAFAVWSNGKLKRALSLSPDSGILEDIGPRLPFEQSYWDGKHPAVAPEDDDEEDPYPFPFDPLELGEAALLEFFGYQIEGRPADWLFDPMTRPLLRFKRKKSRFKLW